MNPGPGLYPILEQLRACLCHALGQTENGPPCLCCVVHEFTTGRSQGALGENSPLVEQCVCGAAWVRLVSVDPLPDNDRRTKRRADGGPCIHGGGFTATIEIGVLRCKPAIPTQQDTCDCLERFAADASEDQAALVKAVQCCELGATIVRMEPAETEQCAGSTLTLTIAVTLCADCEDDSA